MSRVIPRPEVYSENDGWAIVLPGTPVGADSAVFDEAVDDFVEALREYAETWVEDERLRTAPNHRHNWRLVWFVLNRADDELRDWVLSDEPEAGAAAHAAGSGL